MAVDWVLLFHGVKTILDPLASASWPIAVGITAWAFRKPIEAMIGRVRQLSGFGGSADFTSGEALTHQQTAEGSPKASLPALTDTGNLPPSDPVFDILDGQFAAVLEQHIQGGDDKKLAWAIRQRSISEATRVHETNYRLIFGSQIHAPNSKCCRSRIVERVRKILRYGACKSSLGSNPQGPDIRAMGTVSN